MSPHIEKLLRSKNILFLQGPMGGFFNQVAAWLQAKGMNTYKINFNGGDWVFSNPKYYRQCIDYKGTLAGFNHWLEDFVQQNGIDSVVCFGDCRKYHQLAKMLCHYLNIDFFVFEEGYIRPDFITFESVGVNANSTFHIDFNEQNAQELKDDIHEVNNHYWYMVYSAIIYYFFKVILHFSYPHYQHHRNTTTQTEIKSWIRSGYRRRKNALVEPPRFRRFIQDYDKQYFVFPLQVHNDSQILVHSDLKNMEQYIHIVIQDFSLHADCNHHLVIKHHPMDRGYRHYATLIQELAKQYGCLSRVHYFCDIHLPSLLKHSLGVVTVNSTTGLQAFYRGIPVKALGRAIYNLNGLSYQNSLSSFWTDRSYLDENHYAQFRTKLISETQLNGAFYGKNFWKV